MLPRSGFFHFHPLLRDFDFYWRMEPDVHYYCDLDYDPFLYMQVSACEPRTYFPGMLFLHTLMLPRMPLNIGYKAVQGELCA